MIEGLYDGCMSFIDKDLSVMSKEERMKLYDSYGWMFSSGCETPTLEPLIVGNDPRVNTFREKFREWFMVVCNYSFSPCHFGMTSYSHFMNASCWQGTKAKGNKVYPQRVILALGMMGIFAGVKTNYLYLGDKTRDHGREYNVNMEKLTEWTSTSAGASCEFSEASLSSTAENIWTMILTIHLWRRTMTRADRAGLFMMTGSPIGNMRLSPLSLLFRSATSEPVSSLHPAPIKCLMPLQTRIRRKSCAEDTGTANGLSIFTMGMWGAVKLMTRVAGSILLWSAWEKSIEELVFNWMGNGLLRLMSPHHNRPYSA